MRSVVGDSAFKRWKDECRQDYLALLACTWETKKRSHSGHLNTVADRSTGAGEALIMAVLHEWLVSCDMATAQNDIG
jgi:hypothetical protein